MPCTRAQSNILNVKFAEKTDEKAQEFVFS